VVYCWSVVHDFASYGFKLGFSIEISPFWFISVGSWDIGLLLDFCCVDPGPQGIGGSDSGSDLWGSSWWLGNSSMWGCLHGFCGFLVGLFV
jgi:hypothetical protein